LGHTDNTGTDAVNEKLSQKRADAVAQYFAKQGISADRISAKGFGSTQPIADNKTSAGRAQNRRTEFMFHR
jgi:OmpA-OmpF porin, OOP family